MTLTTQDLPAASQILLSAHIPLFAWCRNSFFQKLVQPSGYPYFSWNDRVYRVTADRTSYEDTDYGARIDKATGALLIETLPAR